MTTPKLFDFQILFQKFRDKCDPVDLISCGNKRPPPHTHTHTHINCTGKQCLLCCVILHTEGRMRFRLLSRIVQKLHMPPLLYWGLGTSVYLHSSSSIPDLWSQSQYYASVTRMYASTNLVSASSCGS